jgi:E3 ubiquitin-protein ligase MUL1
MDNLILNSVFSIQKQISSSESSINELKNIADETSNIITRELKVLDKKVKELKSENEKLKKQLLCSNVTDDGTLCILCFEHQRNVLFRPCNHLVICDKCSANTSFDECIICKFQIDTYEYAYL